MSGSRRANGWSQMVAAPLFVALCTVFWCTAAPAAAAVTPSSGNAVLSPAAAALQEYGGMSQNAIEQAWQNLNVKYGGFIPPMASGQWVPTFFAGHGGAPFSQWLDGFFRFFLGVLWQNARLLGTILILAVLAAVLQTIQTAFESEFVSRIAFLVVHLALIVLAVSSFHQATSDAGGAIDTMTATMYGSLPVVLALIAASGGLTSAAIFHPLFVFIVNAVGLLVHNWVFPMIFFSAVLTIVSAVSERFKVTELANFIRTVTLTVLGLSMTAFLGIMSVQGSIAGVSDGVAMRSAKFLAGLVPFVGKALSDASETVAGASLLVKNATGFASAVLLLLICAFPALKIFALALVYNGSAAILQPLGNSPVVVTLSAVGKSLMLVFAALCAVGLMFFFALVIVMAATNTAAFAR